MDKQVSNLVTNIRESLINWRRDFHKYPESGWTEFRTASIIAKNMSEAGFSLKMGEQVIDSESRMGLPTAEELEHHYTRAKQQGAPLDYLSNFEGGFTGLVATMDTGEPGPHIGIRVDIDANDLSESEDPEHFPNQKGFASNNPGVMHACGHDAHAAIGLGVAKILQAIKEEDKNKSSHDANGNPLPNLSGKISIIFQPAEEGVRGAKSMVNADILKDVDFLLGLHIGIGVDEIGAVSTGQENFLSTTKFDVIFTGQPAHAGGAPEQGKNALQAAADAVSGLYGISRHRQGQSRINVGTLSAGTGRNVIPAEATMKMETRGENTEINDFMVSRSREVISGAAQMHGVDHEIHEVGSAPSAQSCESLVDKVVEIAEVNSDFSWYGPGIFSGSEDFAYMMKDMEEKNKPSAYLIFGTPLISGHHTREFDFDESVMEKGVEFVTNMILELQEGGL